MEFKSPVKLKLLFHLLTLSAMLLSSSLAQEQEKEKKKKPKQEKTKQQEITVFSTEADKALPVQVPSWIGTKPPVDGDWVKTFDENFDGPTLNSSTWTPRQAYDVVIHNHKQRYLEENVTLEKGIAQIKCEKKTGNQYNNPDLDSRDYTTGCFTSYGKWTQLYGYFEARVKPTTAKGFWNCFWLMPDRGEGVEKARASTKDNGMEVDIFEQMTNWGPGRYNVALHWDGYKEDHKQSGTDEIYHGPTADGWHVVGVLWEPGKYTFYCDGIKKAEWENPRVGSVPSFIICNVEMRGRSMEEVEDAKLPVHFQFDYVRAWQLKSLVKAPLVNPETK